MDTIFMKEMSFYAFHGVYPEENRLGQRFLVSLELDCDLRKAGASDDLSLSVDYAEVYNMTSEIVQSKPRKLIETVAEDVANAILEKYPQVFSIKVKVEKPEAPIPGSFSSVGVVIKRSRIQENQ